MEEVKYFDAVYKRTRYYPSAEIDKLYGWLYNCPIVSPLDAKEYRKNHVLGPKTRSFITGLYKKTDGLGLHTSFTMSKYEVWSIRYAKRLKLLILMGYVTVKPSSYSGLHIEFTELFSSLSP